MFSMKSRILTGVGIFLGSLLVFYMFVYVPQMEYERQLEDRISRQNMRLVQLKKKFKELEELKEKNRQLQAKLSSLEGSLQASEAGFLHELGVKGKVYNIEYLEIAPRPPVKEEYYSRIPVSIHLLGSYHQLGMLISDMAREEGLGSFTVDEVRLNSIDGNGHSLEANLSLSLYRYKEASTVVADESSSRSNSVGTERTIHTARRKR